MHASMCHIVVSSDPGYAQICTEYSARDRSSGENGMSFPLGRWRDLVLTGDV